MLLLMNNSSEVMLPAECDDIQFVTDFKVSSLSSVLGCPGASKDLQLEI